MADVDGQALPISLFGSTLCNQIEGGALRVAPGGGQFRQTHFLMVAIDSGAGPGTVYWEVVNEADLTGSQFTPIGVLSDIGIAFTWDVPL